MSLNEEFISEASEAVLADPAPRKSTRLEPKNKTHSIREGLQARVKDPLWLLGRQWQVGEFQAHNGGHPVRAEMEIASKPIDQIIFGNDANVEAVPEPLNMNMPLEMKVEEEVQIQPGVFRAKGWNARRLEYSFRLKHGETELVAEEYFGNDLDWYHFDLEADEEDGYVAESIGVKPVPATFLGMPLPRWWAIEDSRVDIGQVSRPHLNLLAMLLLEFSLIYSNDWYVIPVEQQVGTIRKIRSFKVMDSFGIVSNVNPVIDKDEYKQGWEVFTHRSLSGKGLADGRVFYFPNRLYHALESEPIEKVSFFRDELANLVWAVEHLYQDGQGQIINRADADIENVPQQPGPTFYWDTVEKKLIDPAMITMEGEPGNRYIGPVAHYLPMTPIPLHWIPYKPRQVDHKGHYILRRARTVEDPNLLPQYKGIFVGESKYIFEEEITRVGLLLQRVVQMARGSSGERYRWQSRKKRADELHKSSGLRFDALVDS
ncbi:MAG: hypothetical protein R3293_08575 [Candidatus Promineifilaceae bacterium]|nr:hypothetical protein [Candidatus Promineifilaceae bacterium]